MFCAHNDSMIGKCEILHQGQTNAGHRHRLGDEWLESSCAERELGLLVASWLNTSQQCALAKQEGKTGQKR